MDLVLVSVAAGAAAVVTFFSGFGLATVLLPVLAVFMPTPAAIAATAIVHLLNNALKLGLVGRMVDRRIVLVFGVPAFAAAFGGALVLERLANVAPVARYEFAGGSFDVTAVNLVVAALLLVLGLREIVPQEGRGIRSELLPLAGLVSGFIGGLAGLQGALRSAFLVRAGLDAAGFIATGAAIAILVDVSRIIVYAGRGLLTAPGLDGAILAAGVLGGSVGTIIGSRLLSKVTLRAVEVVVGVLLVAVALGLGAGLI